MSAYVVIRPRDDGDSQQASDWADRLIAEFTSHGHTLAADVDDTTPPDQAHILTAVGQPVGLVCYFGHGTEDAWLTSFGPTIDATNVTAAIGKAIVSVACKTGRNLGPNAITSGVTAWLGFTIKVPVVAPHKNRDPFGEAIADGIAILGTGGTMQQARDDIAARCDQLANDFDTGALKNHPAADTVGYFGALALRDHVVLHGTTGCLPL